MITSEQINEYAKAMATAQGQIKNPSKSKTNPHFKSTYADLADGIDATRDAFSANGLCIIQSTSLDGELLVLETRIVHSSGQWVSGTYPVCKLPNTPQNIGSAMTYARRFSLFGLANISGDDDDGAEANKTETEEAPISLPFPRAAISAKRPSGSRRCAPIKTATWCLNSRCRRP